MTLKQAITTALSQGSGHEQLLALVKEHQSDPRRAYEELEQLWQELEFDANEVAVGRAELEFVMEKLWYSSPPSKTAK